MKTSAESRWGVGSFIVRAALILSLGIAAQIMVAGDAGAVSFTVFGTLPGGTESAPTGVSADGSIVVGKSDSGSTGLQAVRWPRTGSMAGLGFLSGGVGSGALAVSSDGAVIVGSGDHGGTSSEASRWTQAGGMVGLGYLAGDDYSQAYGVSGDGSVVGGTSGSGTTNTSQAFRWENNAMTGLGYLPGHASNNSATAGISADGSVIVGYSNTTAGALEAFRWTQGTGMVGLGHIPLFSGIQSGAMAVSADGTVVVGNDLNPTIAQAFRWTAGGGMVGLGFYGPEDGYGSSYANAVTADGSVVVGQGTPDGMNMAAFIWDAVNGTRNLQDVLLSGYGLAPPTGWTLETANGISADGLVITGMMYDADYNELGWVADLSSSSAAVPEPTSMLLVASAMGWLAWMRRRKAV